MRESQTNMQPTVTLILLLRWGVKIESKIKIISKIESDTVRWMTIISMIFSLLRPEKA